MLRITIVFEENDTSVDPKQDVMDSNDGNKPVDKESERCWLADWATGWLSYCFLLYIGIAWVSKCVRARGAAPMPVSILAGRLGWLGWLAGWLDGSQARWLAGWLGMVRGGLKWGQAGSGQKVMDL